MERVALALALAAGAVLVAWVLRHRLRPTGTVAPGPAAGLPSSVERADFPQPGAPWLVAVFTSATCGTCASVWAHARALGGEGVVVADVEHTAAPELHRRYGVDAVPSVAVCDADGRVHRWLLGSTSEDELRAALRDARASVDIRRA